MISNIQKSPWTPIATVIVSGLIAMQLWVAYLVGSHHLLVNNGTNWLPPIAITAFVPVTLFLLAYNVLPSVRAFVLGQDIRTLTMIQLWRVVGFVFLPMYSFGILPGLFAWPAGLGDVAVGLLALLAVRNIDRDENYISSSGLVYFHLFGLADFVVAIVASGLAAGAFPVLIPDGVTSAALDVWPLNIFPSFLVPAFIIVQVTAVLNIREARRRLSQPVNITLQIAERAS